MSIFVSQPGPPDEGPRPSDGNATPPPAPAAQRERAFADALAHDLRAPLRSIDSFAGLLERRAGDTLDETSRDYLARIRAASTRMGSLLAALSELSAVSRTEPQPAPVDLSLLAEWVVAELADTHPQRQVEVVVQTRGVAHIEQILTAMRAEILAGEKAVTTAMRVAGAGLKSDWRAQITRRALGVIGIVGQRVPVVLDGDAAGHRQLAHEVLVHRHRGQQQRHETQRARCQHAHRRGLEPTHVANSRSNARHSSPVQ